MMKLSSAVFHAVFVCSLSVAAALPLSAQSSLPAKMNWWREARFGMFVHFGSYSYLGRDARAFGAEGWTKTEYQRQVSANFNPEHFNAAAIAGLAKEAGMKYLVITAKHHEGFCMWPTGVQSFRDTTGTTLYDLPDFTAFKTRDILRELKVACDAAGIRFCLYYSIMDWAHSSQTITRANDFTRMVSDSARTGYIDDMKAQLYELVTQYHPAVIWFDGSWAYNDGPSTLDAWWTKKDGIALYEYLTGLDPNLLINDRICIGFDVGDFSCPEKEVPEAAPGGAWETCQTMNDSWGYYAADMNYKSPAAIIQEMARVVSKGGNYLLNIGPRGDGAVPDQAASLLNDIGAWMKINSASIHGASGSPGSVQPSWGVFTQKADRLFMHVFAWPENGRLVIPLLSNPINKIYLMADTTARLPYEVTSEGIVISLPASAPDASDCVIAADVVGTPTLWPNSATAVEHPSGQPVLRTPHMEQNFPNPFNPTTTIHFSLPARSSVSLTVFDCVGRRVATLLSGVVSAGFHAVQWDAAALSGGVYFYCLQTDSFSERRKLILLK